MSMPNEFDEYVSELRDSVCSRCIARPPGFPPCSPHGVGCGIEQHVPQLVEICRTTDSVLMDPYIDQLHDTICRDCECRDKPTCPCPLDYLLQLAVEAVERVERRRANRNLPSTTGLGPSLG